MITSRLILYAALGVLPAMPSFDHVDPSEHTRSSILTADTEFTIRRGKGNDNLNKAQQRPQTSLPIEESVGPPVRIPGLMRRKIATGQEEQGATPENRSQ
jgi:hypothetical protein